MFKGNEIFHHIDHVTNYEDGYEVDAALSKSLKPKQSADTKFYWLTMALVLAMLAISAYWLVMEERKTDYVYGGAGYAHE